MYIVTRSSPNALNIGGVFINPGENRFEDDVYRKIKDTRSLRGEIRLGRVSVRDDGVKPSKEKISKKEIPANWSGRPEQEIFNLTLRDMKKIINGTTDPDILSVYKESDGRSEVQLMIKNQLNALEKANELDPETKPPKAPPVAEMIDIVQNCESMDDLLAWQESDKRATVQDAIKDRITALKIVALESTD